jgi:hypothetical protein
MKRVPRRIDVPVALQVLAVSEEALRHLGSAGAEVRGVAAVHDE